MKKSFLPVFIRVEGFNTPQFTAIIIGIKSRIQYLLRSNIPRCSAAGLLIFLLLWPCAADETTGAEAVPLSVETAPSSAEAITPSADDSNGPAAETAVSSPEAATPSAEAASSAASDSPATAVPPASNARDERYRNTLRFGTETEIASLIQTLKNEKNSSLDSELAAIAEQTQNRTIIAGILGFFGEMEKKGIEARAIRAVEERDEEANETVLAAIDYLGKVNASGAAEPLKELIDAGESRFLNNALRALGRAGKSAEDPELQNSTAAFLLDYYEKRNPGDESKREIIVALGETGSGESVSFLAELIRNADEKAPLRMAALDAVSKIGDEEALDAVIEAVSSSDPNVRSSAVGALGPFSGEAADNAILEAFRDSYYRTRIGAAAAAGKRRLEGAVPYLRYRAENDDVPAVRDEAIKALGAIHNGETIGILGALFSERKNSDRVRIAAAEMLLQNDADTYGAKVFAEMEEAKNKKLTALYNGFVRVMVPAKAPALEEIARRFIASGGVIEKSLALDLILNNEFRSLESEVRSLADEKVHGASIGRKAQRAIETLGLNAKPE